MTEDNTPKPQRHWRNLAKQRQWIIGLLERRIDSLEEELRQHQEGETPCH